jgi:hypothetical protein
MRNHRVQVLRDESAKAFSIATGLSGCLRRPQKCTQQKKGDAFHEILLFGIARWFVKDRNIGKRNRRGYGLYVREYIREFLVRHHFASIWRHVARTRIAHVSGESRQTQLRLSESGSRKAALPNGAVTLIAAVAQEKAFTVCGIAGLGLRKSDRREK